MPPPKTPPAKFDVNRKVGPLPLWGWGAVGVGAWWAYRNFYAPAQSAAPAPGVDSYGAADYAGSTAYDGYSGYDGYGAVGGVGGGSGVIDGTTTEAPPGEVVEAPAPGTPGDQHTGGGGRRHKIERLRKRRAALTERIQGLRAGGVTPAEHERILRLRKRRRQVRRRIHRLRSSR